MNYDILSQIRSQMVLINVSSSTKILEKDIKNRTWQTKWWKKSKWQFFEKYHNGFEIEISNILTHKIKYICFSAIPFANYFVPNISQTYHI